MLTEVRNNLDILLVVGIALLVYHLYKKAKGNKKGIAS